jgi:hypothetical protein
VNRNDLLGEEHEAALALLPAVAFTSQRIQLIVPLQTRVIGAAYADVLPRMKIP